MNRTFAFKGYCPEQDKEYAISVNYLDASTMTENKLIRGTAKCTYAISHGCNQIDTCPILKSAPEEC